MEVNKLQKLKKLLDYSKNKELAVFDEITAINDGIKDINKNLTGDKSEEIISKGLDNVKSAVENIKLPEIVIPKSVEVKNFPKVQKVEITNPPKINIPETKFPEVQKVVVENQVEIPEVVIPEYPKEIEIKEPKWFKPFTFAYEKLTDILEDFGEFIFKRFKGNTYDVRITNASEVRSSSGGGGVVEVKNQDPLAKYKWADVDDDASPNYYGAVDKDGNWFILKETILAGANTYRYCKGASGYETVITGAWATRASQTYDYFHNIF